LPEELKKEQQRDAARTSKQSGDCEEDHCETAHDDMTTTEETAPKSSTPKVAPTERGTTPHRSLRELTLNPKLRDQATEVARKIGEVLGQIRSQWMATAQSLAPALQTISAQASTFAKQLETTFAVLGEVFKQLPVATREALLCLGNAGWFLDPEMSLSGPVKIAALFQEGRTAEGDELLTEYFEARLDDIERVLIEALPHRSTIVASALRAHREGRYELVVPVLLAQIDGIIVELAEHSLFRTERGRRGGAPRPEIAVYTTSLEHGQLWAALLSPFGQKLPINFSSEERGPNFSGLNRHLVMHGDSLDYGTQENSLKCVSLLHYAVWILGALQEPDMRSSASGSSA
jgi:hypothetical protein